MQATQLASIIVITALAALCAGCAGTKTHEPREVTATVREHDTAGRLVYWQGAWRAIGSGETAQELHAAGRLTMCERAKAWWTVGAC